jgi:hypothetical protein
VVRERGTGVVLSRHRFFTEAERAAEAHNRGKPALDHNRAQVFDAWNPLVALTGPR